MNIVPLPAPQSRRLQALYGYEILDTPPDPLFDRVTALAARLCDTPIALISFVDQHRQWFLSSKGLDDLPESSRDITFCALGILHHGFMEVRDAARDERFRSNVLVVSEPRVRFYAGVPLLSEEGLAIGVLCVMDCKPRSLSNSQRDGLEDLARLLGTLLQQRREHRGRERGESHFEEALGHSDLMIWDYDVHRQRLQASSRLISWLGADVAREEIDLSALAARVHPDDSAHVLAVLRRTLQSGTSFHVECRIRDTDGRWSNGDLRGACARDGNGRPLRLAGSLREIGSSRQTGERLAWTLQFDPVTGLPNRHLVREKLAQQLARAARLNDPIAVVALNLGGLTQLGVQLSQADRDLLLHRSARILAETLGSHDSIGHLGADEFVVTLGELNWDTDVTACIQRLLGALLRPVGIDGAEVLLAASAGIAMCPAHARDADTLISCAQIAMYRARELGSGTCQTYSPELNLRGRERLQLDYDLRSALTRGEFSLEYQPKLELCTGRICGAEALLRWNHPQRGPLAAEAFIGALEESELVVAVGLWVLEAACWQLRSWQRAGITPPPIAVNLSARQFRQPELVTRLRDILADSGIPPSLLELEITESSLMQDSEATVRSLTELQQLGVTLFVDDFGTGYSSLAYLQRFPLNALKIDRAFIARIGVPEADLSIVRAIIDLGHSLRLTVVAEGVETAAQARFLSEQGCDVIQGYFVSGPLGAKGYARLLADEATGTLRALPDLSTG